MSWFRRSKVALEEGRPSVHAQPAPPPSEQPLSSEALHFLDAAYAGLQERNRECGWPDRRRDEPFVRECTIRTIKEWLKVSDDFVHTEARFGPPGKVTRKLTQADVSKWVEYWDFYTKVRDRAPHDLKGGQEHRERIWELLTPLLEREEEARAAKQADELHSRIARLKEAAEASIDYKCDSDAVVAVAEASIYPDFAAQLRELGLTESVVFDMVARLSELIEQSRRILPKLTPEAVKQFEARVLLSHYQMNQESIDRVVAMQYREMEQERVALEKQISESESRAEARQTNDLLASLNASASNQAHDVARIKWFDMIDGLLGH